MRLDAWEESDDLEEDDLMLDACDDLEEDDLMLDACEEDDPDMLDACEEDDLDMRLDAWEDLADEPGRMVDAMTSSLCCSATISSATAAVLTDSPVETRCSTTAWTSS